MAEGSRSLEYTPTWVVATVCFVIVLLSLLAERGLHKLGKFLKHKRQDALFEALQKLKEELMLLGFISLTLTVFQSFITHICIPRHLAYYMLPCKLESAASGGSEIKHLRYFQQTMNEGRRLLSAESFSDHCAPKGKVPLISLEALHQLHIFIFVLAVVHMIFCATTMVLGGARIRQWKNWEDSIRSEIKNSNDPAAAIHGHVRHRLHYYLPVERIAGYWRKTAVVSWVMSFFKQFYHSVSKSDYAALRLGFIRVHFPSMLDFDFHKYILRTLEVDFKRIVGISWYLWLFVVIFLLLNMRGWHTYFWLAFLPLILLLLVGAKLEHIITRLAQESAERMGGESETMRPSDEYFWFGKPRLVLHLIHFILFQNSFEMAFFFWIWCTYGFRSCIMEELGFIIPRVVIGVIVQVVCSYSTLPLYALVTQMGSTFKPGIFEEPVHDLLHSWANTGRQMTRNSSGINRMAKESIQDDHIAEERMALDEGITSMIELSRPSGT
ncbi:hypothetical protein NMG60_11036587 [Bertholletia excelsa]